MWWTSRTSDAHRLHLPGGNLYASVREGRQGGAQAAMMAGFYSYWRNSISVATRTPAVLMKPSISTRTLGARSAAVPLLNTVVGVNRTSCPLTSKVSAAVIWVIGP